MSRVGDTETTLVHLELQKCEFDLVEVGNPKKSLDFLAGAEVSVVLGPEPAKCAMLLVTSLDVVQSRKPTKRDVREHIVLAQSAIAYLSYFSVEPGFANPGDEKELEDFARRIGIQMIFPYVQQFVMDLTVKAGFPPLILSLSDLQVEWEPLPVI